MGSSKVQNSASSSPGSPSENVSRRLSSFGRRTSVFDKQKPLTPEELYNFGLRQARVGTPYFIDNDEDPVYLRKLNGKFQNVLEELREMKVSGGEESLTNSATGLSSFGEKSGISKFGTTPTASAMANQPRKSPENVPVMPPPGGTLRTPSAFSRRTTKLVGGAEGRSGRSPSTSTSDLKKFQAALKRKNEQALFGQDIFEGIQKEIRVTKKAKKRKGVGLYGFFDFWISRIPVKSPNSQSRQYWDGISIITILYSVYKAMFDQAFFPNSTLADTIDFVAWIDVLVQIFFWVDIIFNFFTAQVSHKRAKRAASEVSRERSELVTI